MRWIVLCCFSLLLSCERPVAFAQVGQSSPPKSVAKSDGALSGPDRTTEGPMVITQEQVTFLRAAAAAVIDEGDEGVVILASELQPQRRYGVVINVENQQVNWIEVHPADNPFPPQVQGEFQPGRYLIEGDEGDTFYVSIRGPEAPTWLTITIETRGPRPPPDDPDDPEDPDEPPPVPGELAELSRQAAASLGDPQTAAALAGAIQGTIAQVHQRCEAGQCPGLDEAKRLMVTAIEMTLLQRTGESRNVDWLGGWRRPMNDALHQRAARTVPDYLSQMEALAQGLASVQ